MLYPTAHSILICGFFKKQSLTEILHQKFADADVEEHHHAYLKPFRILVSLLDKPEIGNIRGAVITRRQLRVTSLEGITA